MDPRIKKNLFPDPNPENSLTTSSNESIFKGKLTQDVPKKERDTHRWLDNKPKATDRLRRSYSEGCLEGKPASFSKLQLTLSVEIERQRKIQSDPYIHLRPTKPTHPAFRKAIKSSPNFSKTYGVNNMNILNARFKPVLPNIANSDDAENTDGEQD